MPNARRSVIAVDLGGTKVAVALVDERGKIRHRIVEPVDTSSNDAPVDQIIRLSKTISADATAVGVAVPGLVRRDGTVWAPNLAGWDRVPLAKLLRRHLHLPVFIESDRNAAVLGETWRGAARGKSDVVVLIVGTGIGAGILSAGRLVRGAHELSGCAGWLVVIDEENDLTRRCGSLEALAAGPAIARAFGAPAAGAPNTTDVAAAARAGDQDAKQVFRRGGHLLGLAVANLISLFDPEAVVLTGGLTNAADLFLDELKRTAMQFAQPLSAPHVAIEVSALQADANLLGAARLALDGVESGSPTRSRPPSRRTTVKRKR